MNKLFNKKEKVPTMDFIRAICDYLNVEIWLKPKGEGVEILPKKEKDATSANIDFSLPILGIDGTPIKMNFCGNNTGLDLTLRDVAVNALLYSETQEATRLEGATKIRRLRLAYKIHGFKGPCSINAKDTALLKDAIKESHDSAPVVSHLREIAMARALNIISTHSIAGSADRVWMGRI